MTHPQKQKFSSAPVNPEYYLPIKPRPKQWEAHAAVLNHVRGPIRSEPGYVYCSVGFGKTILIAMIAKLTQVTAELRGKQQLNTLVIARTGDLIDQNSEKMWEVGARNSLFSASLKRKSTKYHVIAGTEGTVARSLYTQLGELIDEETGKVIREDYKFDIILMDEAYQFNWEDPDCQYMKIYLEFKKRNPKLILIGYGGSYYRGTKPVIGEFWKHLLYSCSMWEAIEIGYCKPLLFGFGANDTEYKDLDAIKPTGIDGTDDLSKELMEQQNKIITQQKTVTHNILQEVKEISASRNCVLITCAGRKHIKQVVEILHEIQDCCDYQDNTQGDDHVRYAIVTDETKTSDRKIIKDMCNRGKIKYVLQIGAWTVGVNVPMFDTIVILRRIGSRTLLEQLVGRGIRWLEDWQKELGFISEDCMCLDYAGTFEAMGEFFDDQFIQAAQATKAKKEAQTIECPRCHTENSSFARRCRGNDIAPAALPKLSPDPRGYVIHGSMLKLKERDGRCGHFWSDKKCEQCGAPNDKVARSCRHCDAMLIDPNDKLTGKHYTDSDYKPVLSFSMTLTKNKEGLIIYYQLPNDELAKEIFYPKSEHVVAKRIFYDKFVSKHLHASWHNKVRGKTAMQIMAMKAIFDVPTHITHRINEKKESVIHRKIFISGREAKAE